MRRAAPALVAGGIAVLAVLALVLPDRLQVAGFATPGSESARAVERLTAALGYDPEPGMVVLARTARRYAADPAARSALAGVAAEIARDPGVGRVQTPFGRDGSQLLLSEDGRAALVLVHFAQPGEQAATPVIDRIREEVRSGRGLALQYGGFAVGFEDDNEVIRHDLLIAELIAFPILALLLIGVFRGVVPALLPLVIGGLSVVGTLACLRLLALAVDVSVYAVNLAAAVGLGLAVDYGLFLVSRFREEHAAGASEAEALATTMATAGRAVLYSGLTVAVACAGLLFFPQQFIYSMGLGGALTALLSVAIALVVIPPLLPWAVTRTEQARARSLRAAQTAAAESGGWYRFSQAVTRRPVAVALASSAVLLIAALPAARVSWTFLDANALPPGIESRLVADAITGEFVPYLEYPVSVAVSRPLAGQAARELEAAVASLPGAGVVTPLRRASDGTGVLAVLPRGPPLSDASLALIDGLRALDGVALVGGRTAAYEDLQASIRRNAPGALLWIAATTLVVLFLLTGSVVLPVKAVLMNALTLLAVGGILVAIFQDGVLGLRGLLDYTGPSAIETTVSVVVIGVTFGLATDYSILLLSRIREAHLAGAPDAEAVALGLQRSGRVISNAALLFAVAMLALASSRVFLVQQLVIGIAAGVAIDATLVRACLVPALMRILGRANWWAPAPLRWLHGRVDGRVALRE